MSEATQVPLCGRSGLARILDCSERTARNLQLAGEIKPEMIVGGRPLFSVAKAHELREKRAQRRGSRLTEEAA